LLSGGGTIDEHADLVEHFQHIHAWRCHRLGEGEGTCAGWNCGARSMRV
jgi:hypothetical protein